jgi:hypothetical protein
MPEIVGNLHLHTIASDGTGTHDEVASAAVRAGLDFLIYTDHNVWVDGIDGWYRDPVTNQEILRLMGQEVNDQNLEPELNHMLCLFVCKDLQPVAADPQKLIDTVIAEGGICFLAHPIERPGMKGIEQTYPWISWDISGYTGIELWNAMTNVKWRLRSLRRGIFGAYLPNWVLSGPFPDMLAKWDELLAGGQKVVAVGSTDAHATVFKKGPLRRRVYPYEYLFRTVNTHILLTEPLARDVDRARLQIRDALKAGNCFVGYDLASSSRGFTFTATSGSNRAIMGDTLSLQETAMLSISSPQSVRLRLLKDGQLIAQAKGKTLEWQTSEPGIYRVEAYRRFWGQQRGWVFTNPIYIEP